MFKKFLLTGLLLELTFSTSLTQAKLSYHWVKVGDEFETWDLKDTFLVENVEKFNLMNGNLQYILPGEFAPKNYLAFKDYGMCIGTVTNYLENIKVSQYFGR